MNDIILLKEGDLVRSLYDKNPFDKTIRKGQVLIVTESGLNKKSICSFKTLDGRKVNFVTFATGYNDTNHSDEKFVEKL